MKIQQPRVGPFVALVLCVLVGCASPVANGTGTKAAAKTTGDLIAMVPDLAAAFPKSLQDGTTATTAKSLVSRSLGDVVTLDPATIPGVRAQGYVELKRELGNNFATSTLRVLKAAVAGKDLPLNTDYKLGLVTMPAGTSGPNGSDKMDLGAIRLSRPQPDTLQALWTLSVSAEQTNNGTTMAISMKYYFDIVIVGTDEATLKVTMGVKGSQTQTAEGKTQTYTLEQESTYDAATGTIVQVTRPETSGGGSMTVLSNKDGFVSYYQVSSGSKSVAYASDTMGGVARSSSYVSELVKTDSISTEFYDGSGDLVEQQWGNTAPTSTTWLPSAATNLKTAFNLATKPSTFQVRRTSQWSGSAYVVTRELSIDGTTWTTYTGSDADSFVWQATTGTWAGGDSVYYYQSSQWTAKDSAFISTTLYKVGYTVPTAQTYLGTAYYLQNTFPLKSLALSSELSNFVLKRKEGTSYYYVYPAGGGSGTSVTEAEYNAAAAGNRSKWTTYSFWLENQSSKDDAQRVANQANPTLGDLSLYNVYDQNFYYWDSDAQTERQTSTTVVNTSEAVPVGFTFGHQALVDEVKSKLEELYQAIPADVLDTNNLKAKADAILVFPDVSNFPVYP